MGRSLAILAALLCVVASPAVLAGEPACQLCREAREAKPLQPLEIEVEDNLTFSRLALVNHGSGAASIDPQTGRTSTEGDLVAVGGLAFQGRAKITGEPFETVRIVMPHSVTMYSAGGGQAELTDFETDLPRVPTLDADGVLEFTFGGKLLTKQGGSGNYRARIPIRVDYN